MRAARVIGLLFLMAAPAHAGDAEIKLHTSDAALMRFVLVESAACPRPEMIAVIDDERLELAFRREVRFEPFLDQTVKQLSEVDTVRVTEVSIRTVVDTNILVINTVIADLLGNPLGQMFWDYASEECLNAALEHQVS